LLFSDHPFCLVASARGCANRASGTRQDNVREVIHGTEIVDELSLKVAFLGWQLGMK
jgi:hypothetical protein